MCKITRGPLGHGSLTLEWLKMTDRLAAPLWNFGRVHHEEQFYEIILNLGQWFRRKCRLKDFLSIALAGLLFGAAEPFMQFWKWASWGIFMEFGPVFQKKMSFKHISYLEFWQPLCSANLNPLCNLGRRYHEEQFCEIILNLDEWLRRKCRLKIFLIWQPFCQQSVTICAILVEEIMRNNSLKLFEFGSVVQEEMSFQRFLI